MQCEKNKNMLIELKFKKGDIVWIISSDPSICKCEVTDVNFIGFNRDGEPELLVYTLENSGSEFTFEQQCIFSNYDECKDWFDNKGGYKTASKREPDFIKEH